MVGEEEFRQADRRALAVQLLLDTATARRAAQTGVDPAKLRDFWLDPIPENLAALLELRKLAVSAVRIHPAGRSTTYFPSKGDVDAQGLEHTTRHTLRVDGAHKEDLLWGFVNATNFGPSMRGISVFGRRLKSREQRGRRQTTEAATVETAVFVTEAPSLAILEPAQYEFLRTNLPDFVQALAAILVALIGGSAVTINCCTRPHPETPEEIDADPAPSTPSGDLEPPLSPGSSHQGAWGQAQREQRAHLLAESRRMPCPRCGEAHRRSTSGSNNVYVQVKCTCGQFLVREHTVRGEAYDPW
jgi:hypothetical protein